MKNIILTGLFLQLGISVLFSQEVLSGVVVQENKKGVISPIPFANVYWQGTNYGTSTDTSGTFQLAVPENAENLIVSYIGFKSDTLRIRSFNKTITVNLQASENMLGAVDIEYRRKSSEMSFINPMQTTNMNEKELFKAACCNLSESFETNPSVDVSFTDAVTGAKQIKMLGLNGIYTMISRENMPGIRGLGNSFGLSFIPGFWVNSIQVTKGVGSVVNGYESIAGQINVELYQPQFGEQTSANVFLNMAGRTELNVIHTEQFSEKVSSTLLVHGNTRPFERDVNSDGFRDFPLQNQINVMNRWKFHSEKGLEGQIGVHFVKDDKEGGELDELDSDQLGRSLYRTDNETESVELFGKTGYVFPGFKYKSTGLQWSVKQHSQNSNFGLRSYDVEQRSAYLNWIYQSIISTTDHQFKTGLSFVYDEYDEQFETLNFNRIERIPGAFFEYTFKPSNNFTLVGGIRGDYHNLFGAFVSPRLHLRYALNETTVIRGLAGSGQRSPTVLMERQSLMASSRNFIFLGTTEDGVYGLDMEKAWNVGANVTKNFTLDYREGVLQFDFYRTTFENQVVVDLDQSSRNVLFYNLSGKSVSNTAQVQVDYELLKFLDMRLAYRWVDVKTDFTSGYKQQPFTPKHRMFINFGYETRRSVKEKNWVFDATLQYLSKQRIPTTASNSPENQRATSSPDFALLSGQITRNFSDRLAVYLGVENILNYRQNNPIIDADNPFGNEFDASMVWGPIFGQNVYGGLRWKLKSDENE